MWAASEGDLEIVRCLLQHGANVNADRALCGSTPLIYASIGGHAAVVRLLLQRGALKHLVNRAGLTARQHATMHPLVLAEFA